ncbi:MAG: GGDEF domain-containing protein [Lachnospiraceae bacterium]|nr:GGDEF domain-containing protein [Lachnospiraceae bacterium]
MINYIISADFMSAIFLVIILVGMYQAPIKKQGSNKYFILCLWICICGLVCDAFGYLFESIEKYEFICEVFIFLAFSLTEALTFGYSLYLTTLIKSREQSFGNRFVFYIGGLCLADFILITIGSISGHLFSVENGKVIYGPIYDYVYIISLICVISIFVFLLMKRKVLGTKDTVSLLAYIIAPVISVMLIAINDEWAFSYEGSAIGLMLVFVMIQSRSISENSLRAEIYSTLSCKDVLTGLKNRRGFQQVLDDISYVEKIGILFCDVNSLKVVNDNQGHEAGDELLKGFADMLKEGFKKEEICRISGDEFVVIFRDINEGEALEKVNTFHEVVMANRWIASCGYETGTGDKKMDIISSAEKKMYLDKQDYYITTGKDRRR